MDYIDLWRQGPSTLHREVLEFWARHHAVADRHEAMRRLGEVVLVARQSSGELAAVSSARDRWIQDLDQTLYYYRCFVSPAFRRSAVVLRLTRRSVRRLAEYCRDQSISSGAHSAPCGVYLELESPLFKRHLRQAVWPLRGLEFVYIGTSARGLERRVLWFDHARIDRP